MIAVVVQRGDAEKNGLGLVGSRAKKSKSPAKLTSSNLANGQLALASKLTQEERDSERGDKCGKLLE